MQPLVSIICLCYNHRLYLPEALASVQNQTYPNLEIIIVDDASTDGSAEWLTNYCQQHPQIKYIQHTQNTGNTRAFNEAFKLSAGEFIIDFATDDVLFPNRVTEQVKAFQGLDQTYGVVYTDAKLIDEKSKLIGHFYQRDAQGNVISRTPSGYVFTDILKYAFLCPPTLMFRRSLLEKTGGYDETLAYEDFDVWVRSAQEFQFYFLDKILTRRRVHAASLSHQLYTPGDKQLASTVIICRKAQKLIRTSAEKEALIIRVKSELRQAVFTQNFPEARELVRLLEELTHLNWPYHLLKWAAGSEIRLGFIRKWYYHWVYNKS
ncbi:MAG: glycosyltransferase family 2 protein [Adhaeribacter sp.]